LQIGGIAKAAMQSASCLPLSQVIDGQEMKPQSEIMRPVAVLTVKVSR
jgi:hypothetical protein